VVSEEVRDALATNKPVVALESTIYTHGAIGKDLELESIIRRHGGVPAVCGIHAGTPKVGLLRSEVQQMVAEGARKVSRRDLAYLVGTGSLGQKLHGGTTIAGTMILARLAGIRVFGTGGLGGVHRGGHDSMDISADLTELGRTRVAVVCSGSKGFLDIPRTLEYLETQGVAVATFADGREGVVDFPAFWARESGIRSPAVVEDERQAAAIILAQERLGIESGLLFANPIPEHFAIPQRDMEAAIDQALREADERRISGSANTPFILGRLKELTRDATVPANVALVQANVERATKIAAELCHLLGSGSEMVSG
jgi:pseudouridylate synthase / pseudouridine kinase